MDDQKSYRSSKAPTPRAKQSAKQLRANLTPPERILWSVLKANKIANCNFRKQSPLGPYIADFYCHQARLVVEVDGSVHQGDQRIHDTKRDQWMESKGIKVFRIQAREVFNNFEAVVRTITHITEQRIQELHPPKKPTPPPLAKGK